LFQRLHSLALEREPDAIIAWITRGSTAVLLTPSNSTCGRIAAGFKVGTRKSSSSSHPRSGLRAKAARTKWHAITICLLTIFPFEKSGTQRERRSSRSNLSAIQCWTDIPAWIVECGVRISQRRAAEPLGSPSILLLPGSRPAELKRHLRVMLRASGTNEI